MPSLKWNNQTWGASYEWSDEGEEWSVNWGSSETQWTATLLPRVRNFLPAGRVLEIAPGHGRWTQYLLPLCDEYIGVDLAEACVAVCQRRFESAGHGRFFVNDGRSLPMVADNSIDFVFSFDSLVHAEAEIIKAYLSELSRVMAPQGIGFLHHSNLGSHLAQLRLAQVLKRSLWPLPMARRALRRWQIIEWDAARGKSMTADRFAEFCREAGLVCVGQEIINWKSKTIDCLSLVARPGSQWDRPNAVVENPNFIGEAYSARAVADLYASLATNTSAPASATPSIAFERAR